MTPVELAYRRCEQITRTEAKNFSYGIRLLPPEKRQALSAVYAFARRVDDIGDGDQPAPDKLAGLDAATTSLHTIDTASPDDPVLLALRDARSRLNVPLDVFDELIDGCRADVLGVTYPTFTDLHGYCTQVAGSIGRLSLAVFGAAQTDANAELANALGVALQLTNILRDIKEDRVNGRIYLPAEDLERFGCTLDLDEQNTLVDDQDNLLALVEYEVVRAQEWYDNGLRLLPQLDRRSRACCGAMAGIYHQLLHSIALRPWVALRERMSLPAWEKAAVAARALGGAAA
jgi:phytoene synthase